MNGRVIHCRAVQQITSLLPPLIECYWFARSWSPPPQTISRLSRCSCVCAGAVCRGNISLPSPRSLSLSLSLCMLVCAFVLISNHLFFTQDYKCVFGANVKWSSLTKLRRKVISSDSKPDTLTAPEQLIQDTEEIISHRTKCSHELPK